jgi:hypothetical protein
VGFQRNLDYLDWDRANRPASGRMDRLAIARPAALGFWYRESPEPLWAVVGLDRTGPPDVPPVTLDNPPASERGMRYVRLDMKGRLFEFGAIPLATDGTAHPAKAMDWTQVFSAAGLDRQAFQPATPSWTPPFASDEQAAWTGVFPEQPDLPLRLEAAAYRGRLVSFRVAGPWTADRDRRDVGGASAPGAVVVYTLMLIGVLLAWVNTRIGRVDRRGAVRLVVPFFSLALAAWAVGAHHVATWELLPQVRLAISQALVGAATLGISYLAVEPHVRRRWPTVLVAWSRVLSGRWGDPLVGRDVLAGLGMGAAAQLAALLFGWWGSLSMDPDSSVITSVLSVRTTLAQLMSIPLQVFAFSFLLTVLLLVLRTVTRSDVVAVLLVVVLATASTAAAGAGSLFVAVAFGLLSSTCLIRFGLVALVAYFLVGGVLATLRAALAWNSGGGGLILMAIVGLTLGAAYLAMGSPKLPRAAGPA